MSAELSVNEVAELAGVPVRAVNKAIEERIIIPSRRDASGRKRLLPVLAVPYAAVVDKIELRLTIEGKRRLARTLMSRKTRVMTAEPIEIAPAVILDVSKLVGADLGARSADYVAARDRFIEIDPDVLGGTPVIRGTRISVYSLLGRIEHGDAVTTITEDYPELAAEAIETALTYARTHPLIGRPGGRPWRKSH